MKLAMWLLRRFGVLERNESLMGDLVEERAAGRSAFWFWGQTLAAIGDMITGDLREHWLLALRAIATGWAVGYAVSRMMSLLVRDPLWGWHFRTLQFLGPLVVLAWPVLTGWIVALTHRTRQASMVLASAASLALCSTVTLTVQAPTYWPVVLGLNWLAFLMMLLGGLLARPKRTSLRTPTL